MNHCCEGRNKPDCVGETSSRVNRKVTDIRSPIPFCFICEAEQLSSLRVQLRMCSEGQGRQLAVKILKSYRLQCSWIHGVRRCIFFACKKATIEVYDVGVRCGPYLELYGVCVLVAVFPSQCLPCLSLARELFSPNIALLEMTTPFVDPKGADTSIAVEPLRAFSETLPRFSKGCQPDRFQQKAAAEDRA